MNADTPRLVLVLVRVARVIRSVLTARTLGGRKRLTVILLASVLACYTFGEVILALRHEPWRDESQAWLIARDASLSDLFGHVLSEEGHPALWYLLLMPFAKLGAPYQSMTVISLTVMVVAVVVLFIADIPLWVKVVVPFTPLCIYYLPVMSRSYCLVALCRVLVISLYPARRQRPWRFAITIALAFQIHVWMFGFAGTLFLLFAIDLHRFKRSLWPLLAPLASMVLTVMELMPRNSADAYVQLHLPSVDWATFGKTFLLMMLCAWLAGWRCGVTVCSTYGWVLVTLNVLYPFYGPQKMSAFLWMMLACGLMSERDSIERRAKSRGKHARPRSSAMELSFLRATLCMLLAVAMAVPLGQRLISPWYWDSVLLDARNTVSLGASLASEVQESQANMPAAVVVPIPNSSSVYAASNALPYLPSGTRLWNSMTGHDMTYADDVFRVSLNHESPSERLPERTVDAIAASRAAEAIVIGCAAYADSSVSSQFAVDVRFQHAGTVSSPDATKDQTWIQSPGFRCDIYLYRG